MVAAALALLGGSVAIAGAQGTSPFNPYGTPVNGCGNPVLFYNTDGWGPLTAGTTPVWGWPFDHVVAERDYNLRNNSAGPVAGIYLPQRPVRPGQTWEFALDTRTGNDPAQVRMEVDWYAADNRYLGHQDGPWVDVNGQPAYTRVAATFTAPANAARGNVLARAQGLAPNSGFASTMCTYTPKQTVTPPPATTTPAPPPATTTVAPPPATTTVAPPPATTTTAPPPSTDGVTAAQKFGWGTPVAAGSDEFNYTGPLNPAIWSAYNGEGHAGNGTRSPSAFSVGNGVVTVTGNANGVSGGAAMEHGQFRGKWEARMRVERGDRDYHPVLLLWPDAEDWPVGGEVDFAEMESTATEVDFFLHYGADNSQTHAAKAVDITQWHNYAVYWDANVIRGYIDGVQFFEDTNRSHLPPRSMHATMQLDAFGGDSGYTPTKMIVDWYRTYPAG